MKDCNGTCIATTECCGGCPSGYQCSNGSCVSITRECLYVGDILYHDKTCSGAEDSTDTSKTVIGVVFDVNRKLAIALDVDSLLWSSPYQDIPQLTNFASSSEAKGDYDGKSNTSIIIAHGDSNDYETPAADYCYNYVTAGTKKGDWYLPAAGELQLIYDNKTTLNKSLRKVSGIYLISDFYWSSSEQNRASAWPLHFVVELWSSRLKSGGGVTSYSYVCPVLAF